MRVTVSLRVASVMAVPSVGAGRAPGAVQRAGDLGGHAAVPHGVEHLLEVALGLPVDERRARRCAATPPPTRGRRRTTSTGSCRGSTPAPRRRPAPGPAGTGRRRARPARRRTARRVRWRAWRSERSMASIRSALTIETSSITRVSMVLSSLRSSAFCSMSWSAMSPIDSRNSEWIVCPPTLRAATPVGAQMTTCFEVFHDRWFEQRRLAGAGPAGDEDVLAACPRSRRTRACCSAERATDTGATDLSGEVARQATEGGGAVTDTIYPRLPGCTAARDPADLCCGHVLVCGGEEAPLACWPSSPSGAARALLVVVGFAVTVVALNATVYSAGGFARGYVDAVDRGDTSSALTLAGVEPTDELEDALLDVPSLGGLARRARGARARPRRRHPHRDALATRSTASRRSRSSSCSGPARGSGSSAPGASRRRPRRPST